MQRERYNFQLADPQAAGRLAAAQTGIIANTVDTLGKGIVEYGEMQDEALAHKLQATQSQYKLDRKLRDTQDPYRLITEDGKPNQAAIEEEKQLYHTAMVEAYGSGFCDYTNTSKYQSALANELSELEKTLAIQQVGQISQFCTDNLKLNMELAEQTGDYSRVTQLIDHAEANNFCSVPQAQLMRAKLTQDEILCTAQQGYNQDPSSFIASLDAGDYDHASPATRAKLHSLYRKAQKASTPASSTKTNKAGVPQEYSPHPAMVSREMADIWNQYNGQFPDDVRTSQVNPLLQNHVRYLLAANQDPSQAALIKEDIRTLIKQHGGDEGLANEMIAVVEKELYQADTVNIASVLESYNYADNLDEQSRTDYARYHQQKTDIETSRSNSDYYYYYKNDGSSYFIDDDTDADKSKARKLEIAQDDRKYQIAKDKVSLYHQDIATNKANVQRKVQDDYAQWYAQNKTATYLQQMDHLLGLIEKHTANATTSATPWAQDHRQNALTNDEQRIDQSQSIQENVLQYQQTLVPSEDPSPPEQDQELSISANYNSVAKRPDYMQEAALYVPEDSTLTSEEIDLYNGKNYTRAKIIRTPDVTTPTPSGRLRANLGDIEGYSLKTLNIQKGQGTFSNTAPKKQAASYILDAEARTDKQGRLQVYKLPSGDGGGTYEVAGINQRYHPTQAARLKSLIEQGRHQQARQEAEQYITRYTAPAKKLAQDAGYTGDGEEYFLRDVYMNGGSDGAKAVLRRAQAKSGDPLTNLAEARVEWYHAIIAKKSYKQKFLKGWLNRTETAYQNALALNH